MRLNTLYTLLLAIFAVATSVKAMAQSDENGRNIEIVVHRGANKLAPENTVPSALVALKHGATWVELDVRCSKDGVMFNLHDETLNRTTNGNGLIGDMLSADIDKLDAGSWFGSEFAGLRVPRISEMLDSLQGRANVFFDVKRGTDVAALIALVRQKDYTNKSFFWFADPKMLNEFTRLAPEMKVKVNAQDVKKLKSWMKVCRPSYVETDAASITPKFRKFCHRHGIKIMAAIQGANEDAYREAIKARPDMVNLDQPELFTEVMKK